MKILISILLVVFTISSTVYAQLFKYNKEYTSDFDLNDENIKNMPNYDTRTYRFEFPDGTTGYGTKTEFDRIMKENYTFGFIEVGGEYFFKNTDGTYKTGWYQEGNNWYYFDNLTFALVRNELREIDGKIYYFNENGVMETNRVITINGTNIYIDNNGYCSQTKPDNFVTKEEMREQFISDDNNFKNARIVGNADGVTHITVSSSGQLYIAYPTMYLSDGDIFTEFGVNMEKYITSQMPNQCVEVYNIIEGGDSVTLSPITINDYKIADVTDGVIYYTGVSPIVKIYAHGFKQEPFNVTFNFAYVIKTSAITSNYSIS